MGRGEVVGGDVARWVVSGGVGTEAVQAGFDESGAPVGQRTGLGFLHGVIDGRRVITVHQDSGHSEGLGLGRETLGCGLQVDRGRDGPLIV